MSNVLNPKQELKSNYWQVEVIAPNGLTYTQQVDGMLVDLRASGPVDAILDDNLKRQVWEMYHRRAEKNPNA